MGDADEAMSSRAKNSWRGGFRGISGTESASDKNIKSSSSKGASEAEAQTETERQWTWLLLLRGQGGAHSEAVEGSESKGLSGEVGRDDEASEGGVDGGNASRVAVSVEVEIWAGLSYY